MRRWGGASCCWKRAAIRARDAERLPDDYDVPAFHAFATENPAIRWDFFVDHYADEARGQRETRKRQPQGVLYPRAGTLGGCTAHNALIFIAPHDFDWDGIAALTGDTSWRAAEMQRYFRRVEACRHRPAWRLLSRLGLDPTGHGWDGWLATEVATPREAFGDDELMRLILGSALAELSASERPLASLARFVETRADPNDRRRLAGRRGGICYTPLSTSGHRRNGTRERVLDVAARHPDRLRVEFDALAVRVMLDEKQRAVGVEYLKGKRLYRAHAAPNASAGERRVVHAARDVILAGGAFNTPQLLMLSGIGPRAELEAHGIPVRVDLPGVGQNLQDRYEVGVVNRLSRDWDVARRGPLREGRCDPPPMGRAPMRHVRLERHSGRPRDPLARGAARPRPLPDGIPGALRGLLSGLFPGGLGAPQLSHLVHPEGAYAEPRRHGAAALRRSARHAAHQFPLFRGRRRQSRRGSRAPWWEPSEKCAA